jgi:hypothetical protein
MLQHGRMLEVHTVEQVLTEQGGPGEPLEILLLQACFYEPLLGWCSSTLLMACWAVIRSRVAGRFMQAALRGWLIEATKAVLHYEIGFGDVLTASRVLHPGLHLPSKCYCYVTHTFSCTSCTRYRSIQCRVQH